MPEWLGLYHRMPYPIRVLAASTRGFHLRSWRYTAETETLVEEALAREWWSAERWRIWREERLAHVLHRAATRVPYYRMHWARRRAAGDGAPWDILSNWPVLDKETLRSQPRAFVADDCNIRRMFPEHTSGTTGKPLHLWWSRETVRQWYALYEARVRGWNGVDRRDRWAILGGQLVVPAARRSPPFWVWNAGLRQLYLSSYHLAPDYVEAYLEAIRRHRVRYLLGYPSAMAFLASVALERGLNTLPLVVVVSNAERLLPTQRSAVGKAFGCPVRDTYGMAEIVTMANECEQNSMHLWPEVGVTEVLREDVPEPVKPAESGRLVCTSLLNLDMPLIRYEVGDEGSLAAAGTSCACGRTLPVLRDVEGRLDDVIRTRDGRRIGRMDPVFKADLPIREAQIIQETLDRVRVRLVPADGYDEWVAARIVRMMQDRLGEVHIVLEPVKEIRRTANGKLRSVVSMIANEPEASI